MSKILTLSSLRPETALENLNRLTGLDFQQWPESLLNEPVAFCEDSQPQQAPARSIGQATEEKRQQQG
ncbi:hypothetical protein MWU49_16115 [Alcanivorax sp. S6407]|uniref:hypothetical protein n=1 Tax=Alcanivorax sp. S6407 TaxID=2926424 RepID=UPI001FF53CB8|nr:hypothetical protein [Alcanivorax sp. S6407]MCK0155241.1 hypothetical protein [Alcanivorax sp. S6407]